MATWDAQGIEIKTTNWTQWHTPGIPAWVSSLAHSWNPSLGNWRQEDEKFVIKVTTGASEIGCEEEKRSRNKRAAPLVPSSKGHTKAEATAPPETGVK